MRFNLGMNFELIEKQDWITIEISRFWNWNAPLLSIVLRLLDFFLSSSSFFSSPFFLFFLSFFHSARRKCKCIVTELLFQFFWLSRSRKYVDVEIEWNLSSVFFVLFYFLPFHLTRGIRIFFISNDFELECFIRYINV